MSAVYPPQGGFAFPGRVQPQPQSHPHPQPHAPAARAAVPAAAAPAGFALSSFPELPQGGRAGRGPGLAVVVLLHVLLAWALASGLARTVVEIVKKPIEMSIIKEVPPPPPPKVEKIKEIPKVKLPPPPPAYVPPPEVVVAAPPAPVIQAVQAEPPQEPVVIAPPPPPTPAPEPPKPVVVKQEVSLACPGYQTVLASVLEEAIDRVGIVGTVRTLLKVRGTQVVEAVIQSGPKEYHKYVQTAVKRMRCSASGADEVQVLLDVAFKK